MQLFNCTRKNLIGEGSHSVVFKAQFSYLNNPDIIPCAVKKLHTDIDSNNTGKNEFDILKLLHHDNIITLLSFQQDLESGHHLLVLELCDNENLWSYQQLNPKLITENSFSRWARQLSSAILYLKSKSVIHCDIKSHNILLTSDLEAKISDFGNSILLSKGFDDSNDGLGRGTLPFSAPELLSESFSFSVDVYSFGVVLFTLLSGQLPFPGKSNMTILMGIKKGFFECGMQRECWVYGNGCGVGRDVEYLIRRMVSKVSINRPSCIELFEFWSAK